MCLRPILKVVVVAVTIPAVAVPEVAKNRALISIAPLIGGTALFSEAKLIPETVTIQVVILPATTVATVLL
jgi:hypothetical protein